MPIRFSNWIRATVIVVLALAASGCASDHTSYKVGSHVYEDAKPVPPRARTVIGQPQPAVRTEPNQ